MKQRKRQGTFESLKNLDVWHKVLIAVCAVGLLLTCIMVVGLFSFILSGSLIHRGQLDLADLFTRGLLRWSGLGFTIPLFLIVGFLILRTALMRIDVNYVDEQGKYGEQYMKNKTFGSAQFMSHREAKEYYDVEDDVNDVFGIIYGQLKEDPNEIQR